jgi:hypothetical protein
MANRTFDKVQTLGKGRVLYSALIGPNGTGVPTLNANKMGITSVTRVSQGIYRLTFTDQFFAMQAIGCSMQVASGGARTTCQVAAYSLTNKTVDVAVYQSAPLAAGAAAANSIQLPLAEARILTSNAIDTKANAGGIGASNSAPTLAPTNGATDPSLVLSWAASGGQTVAWYVTVPSNIGTSAPTLQLLADMSGGTDTPTITVAAFQGVGGSNLGGATAALAPATASQPNLVSLALTAALTYPNMLAITLTPGAHTTNAVNLYGAWLEYSSASELVDLSASANNQIHVFTMYKNSQPGT